MTNVKQCLQIKQLACARANRQLFTNVEFSLASDQLLQLEGPNGCGKSSLLRILAGLLPATGDIIWQGQVVEHIAADYYQQLFYLGQKPALRVGLTVIETLQLEIALFDGMPAHDLQEVLTQFRLLSQQYTPVQQLSQGQRQRLALCHLLLTNKKLWLLDEPFTSLDADGCERLSQLLVTHCQHGGMVIIAHHQPLVLTMPVTRLSLGEGKPC